MPIPIISGYSRATIQKNLSALVCGGYDRNSAIRHAFNAARASFFKANKHGALPTWLAYPKDRRTFDYYLPNGSPIRDSVVERNPVRELDMSDEEREQIKRDVQKQLGGKGAAVRKSAAMYTDFTGHTDINLDKVAIPHMPDAVVAIGQCDGVLYSTIRDNVAEKYIHKFKARSRPLLAASPDGKQLYLIGGSFNFTDRGIVDK